MNVIASVLCEAIPKSQVGDCFGAKIAPRNDKDLLHP